MVTEKEIKSLKGDDVEITLQNPVVLESYRRLISVNTMVLSHNQTSWGEYFFRLKYRDAGGQMTVSRMDQMNSQERAAVYMQIRKELLERLPEITKIAQDAIDGCEGTLLKVRDAFANDLIFVEI
jgi:hypothetical protein